MNFLKKDSDCFKTTCIHLEYKYRYLEYKICLRRYEYKVFAYRLRQNEPPFLCCLHVFGGLITISQDVYDRSKSRCKTM